MSDAADGRDVVVEISDEELAAVSEVEVVLVNCQNNKSLVKEEDLIAVHSSSDGELSESDHYDPIVKRLRFHSSIGGYRESYKRLKRRSLLWPTVCWDAFSFTISMRGIVELINSLVVELHPSKFYVGVSSGPQFRMHGSLDKCVPGHIAPPQDYNLMYVMTCYNAPLAAAAERFIISELRVPDSGFPHLMKNKGAGGERISNMDFARPIYFYVVFKCSKGESFVPVKLEPSVS
jgi:hypothetical protein